MGNRYVWQGGQSENQGRQTKNFSWHFVPNFIKRLPTVAWNPAVTPDVA